MNHEHNKQRAELVIPVSSDIHNVSEPIPKKPNINPACDRQIVIAEDNFLAIKCPARILISAETGLGKSTFIAELIKNRERMFSHTFERIVLSIRPETTHVVADEINRLRKLYPALMCVEGIPAIHALIQGVSGHVLVIIDDQMHEIATSPIVAQLMTFSARHLKINMIMTCQNLFLNGRNMVTIKRNCNYLVVFQSLSDKSSLMTLGRYYSPFHPSFLSKCMNDAIKHSYNTFSQYLLIDQSIDSQLPDDMRVSTRIFSVAPIYYVTPPIE
jgi:hypothetical protein